ncbi:MAG: beta-N-acetylhexosaminidase [Pelagibacterales bacterium]|nr:beta-N-acetylhexosaminidase [Pelagibacterales bacterium]
MTLLQKISQNRKVTKPVIYGVEGAVLSDAEKYFFSKNGGVGFIVFARNIEDKHQLKELTKSIREVMEGEVLVLVDQEGGSVARLKEPVWKKYPSGQYFADLYQENQNAAKEALFKNFQEIASDLVEVGINVDCAPVLDVLTPKTHQVIGDRAYGNNPKQVSDLARKVCEGLLSKEVYPVIKHIPGHGRGTSDSHLELPKVDASIDELRSLDFPPFIDLNDQKFAMTAHILYSAIDKENCATTSKKAIDLIRNEIGFQNILMSDDVSMKALSGSFYEKSKAILNAGCDLVLHCNGIMEEMLEINSALPNLTDNFWEKFTK